MGSIPEALVRIAVLESSRSGRRIFPPHPTDNFWTTTATNGITTSGANTSTVTATASSAPMDNKVSTQLAKYYTNSNILGNTFTKSLNSGFSIDISIPKSKHKSYPDRESFRESAIVEIPMADPKLFEKINHHVFRLIEKSRDFGPIDADPECI